MIMDARLGEAALRESDLLAFQIAIERGRPGSVMCAYNRVNGDYACENDFLLNQVLKRDWAYPGWVMSDWGAVHSTEKAANNGLDQESGQELDRQIYFGAPLGEAVAAGRVSEARLDDMVVRILTGLEWNRDHAGMKRICSQAFTRPQRTDQSAESRMPFIQRGCSSTRPQPMATHDSGSSATDTGRPV